MDARFNVSTQEAEAGRSVDYREFWDSQGYTEDLDSKHTKLELAMGEASLRWSTGMFAEWVAVCR